ncbi:MAG: DUF5615 family PIN-like protein [Anaerolineae bacterium]
MRIVLDACVPRRYKLLLEAWGHEVVCSSDHIAADATDQAVLELAVVRTAALITVDLDFADIRRFSGVQHFGIVIMRHHIAYESDMDVVLRQALQELTSDDLRNALVIIMRDRYRCRRS